MLDSPRCGKRGPAPSWKLGSTRAIRVPIVLADALLNLARRIDRGEVALVDTLVIESNKQVSRQSVDPIDASVLTKFESDHKKQSLEEQIKEKQALAATSAEFQARCAEFQARCAEFQATCNALQSIHANSQSICTEALAIRTEAQASYAKARTLYIDKVKR